MTRRIREVTFIDVECNECGRICSSTVAKDPTAAKMAALIDSRDVCIECNPLQKKDDVELALDRPEDDEHGALLRNTCSPEEARRRMDAAEKRLAEILNPDAGKKLRVLRSIYKRKNTAVDKYVLVTQAIRGKVELLEYPKRRYFSYSTPNFLAEFELADPDKLSYKDLCSIWMMSGTLPPLPRVRCTECRLKLTDNRSCLCKDCEQEKKRANEEVSSPVIDKRKTYRREDGMLCTVLHVERGDVTYETAPLQGLSQEMRVSCEMFLKHFRVATDVELELALQARRGGA